MVCLLGSVLSGTLFGLVPVVAWLFGAFGAV